VINKITRPPITHVAVRFRDQIWSLPRPYRHHHVFRTILFLDKFRSEKEGLPPTVTDIDVHEDDEGFLDESGKYRTRRSAYINALLHEQIIGGKLVGSVMTSEDLW